MSPGRRNIRSYIGERLSDKCAGVGGELVCFALLNVSTDARFMAFVFRGISVLMARTLSRTQPGAIAKPQSGPEPRSVVGVGIVRTRFSAQG